MDLCATLSLTQTLTYAQEVHRPVVSNHGPGEGHDVVHDFASGAQTAPDRRAEEVVIVAVKKKRSG